MKREDLTRDHISIEEQCDWLAQAHRLLVEKKGGKLPEPDRGPGSNMPWVKIQHALDGADALLKDAGEDWDKVQAHREKEERERLPKDDAFATPKRGAKA